MSAEPCDWSGYRIKIEAPANGRVGKATVEVLNQTDTVCHSNLVDLRSAGGRKKAAKEIAEALKIQDSAQIQADLDREWNASMDERRRLRKQAEAGSPEAAPEVAGELLDAPPAALRRPLCLVGGRAYAAAWCQARLSVTRQVDPDTGEVKEYDPPAVTIEDRLVILRDDGQPFADGHPVAGTRPLAELGLSVRLPHQVPPGSGWSGAGVKRYLSGDRPDPAGVFRQLACVVDHFLDFSRSLGPQETMSELVACYVLATWLLDAFNVVGYLWPNGEPGSGKTTLLQVIAQTGYLGQLILAGSSYPTLRDLADYGATLAFDDAEAVMDPKRGDPDKRTLLLAGNRRGAIVAVKELAGDRWVTRHVDTFCPRSFSAIRLPDQVLGSRTVIVPLVRSGDGVKSKRNPMAPDDWPGDRGRLVDDLWALGLANLRELPALDRGAAGRAKLVGRALEPWRSVLAVALWLEERHGQDGLFGRLEELSVAYQQERGEYEDAEPTRVLFRALLQGTAKAKPDEQMQIVPSDVAQRMNVLARQEDLGEPGKDFTSARRVGWLLKRQRFRRGERTDRAKAWQATRAEIEAAARAHGVEVP